MEKNSEKIIISKPKKNIIILENLNFRLSLGKNNNKHKVNVKIGTKSGFINLSNNSFCICLIAGSLHLAGS